MAQPVTEAFDRNNRIIRRPEVSKRVALSRSALYRRIAEGTFPKPVILSGGRAVGWLESEVEAFIAECIAQRDKAATR
jgi:prophage regulatory protein